MSRQTGFGIVDLSCNCLLFLLAFTAVAVRAFAEDANLATNEPPFAAYVRDTGDFAWELNSKVGVPQGGAHYDVSLVSQNWHGAVWKHSMQVATPSKAAVADLAVIFVNGGPGREGLHAMAEETGVPCVNVGGIYQPCFGQQGGDEISLYSIRQYVRTGDATWLISAATTRALVRAMDALEALSTRETGTPFKRFILTGFSKMGLACWMAAIMDARVVGIVPIGADLLNTVAQLDSNPRLFGALANAETGALPTVRQALTLFDPYTYRHRLTAAKLVISGTNDEHYDINSVASYWDGIPGPKWNLYLENADHAHEPHNPRTTRATVAFVRAIAAGRQLPHLELRTSQANGGLAIRVNTSAAAKRAWLWVCRPTGEFKFARWSDTPLTADPAAPAGYSFAGRIEEPATGRVAAYVEVAFEDEFGAYTLTTGLYLATPSNSDVSRALDTGPEKASSPQSSYDAR